MDEKVYLCPDCGSEMKREYKSRFTRIFRCPRCLKRIRKEV